MKQLGDPPGPIQSLPLSSAHGSLPFWALCLRGPKLLGALVKFEKHTYHRVDTKDDVREVLAIVAQGLLLARQIVDAKEGELQDAAIKGYVDERFAGSRSEFNQEAQMALQVGENIIKEFSCRADTTEMSTDKLTQSIQSGPRKPFVEAAGGAGPFLCKMAKKYWVCVMAMLEAAAARSVAEQKSSRARDDAFLDWTAAEGAAASICYRRESPPLL